MWGLICPAATEAVGPSGSARRAGRLCIIWTAVEPSAATPNAEGTVKLQELLDNPGTAAFSRIKYLQRYAYDDQVKEFINALFLVAAESRYQGDWQQLIDFLDHWDEVATDLQFQSMRMPEAGAAPWAPLQKPLAQSTIALVTTGSDSQGQAPHMASRLRQWTRQRRHKLYLPAGPVRRVGG